jgi:hypothetical protein
MFKLAIRGFEAVALLIFLTAAVPFSATAQSVRCEQLLKSVSSHIETSRTGSDKAKTQAPVESLKLLGKPVLALAEKINAAISESADPYSLSHDVFKQARTADGFKSEMAALHKAALEPGSSKARAEKLNAWVQSEAHALLLYDLFSRSGLENFKEELEYLRQNSVYFIESYRSGNGLISYSFEKEGTSGDISLLYRSPSVPEKDWLQFSEADRMKQIRAIHIPEKEFVKSNVIAPTELKPDAVGGYSQEYSGIAGKDYNWEISHKKYEIDRHRLMREVQDVANLFNQTHSFHLHVVFEIPKHYEKYEDFIYWYKQVNDYLYMKGLEEGLHGNALTGVANIYGDLSWTEKINSWIQRFSFKANTIPEGQWRLGKRSSKYFSAGLRTGMYGPPSAPELMKIGIELRDTTRNITVLGQYTERLSKSIEDKVWEHGNAQSIKESNLRLTSSAARAKESLSGIVSPRFAKMFSSIEPTVYFGLIKFEEAKTFDYRQGRWMEVPEATKERIRQARTFYEKELRDLEIELTGLEKKGEKTEDEIIKLVLRTSLATWAKRAKASELMAGI